MVYGGRWLPLMLGATAYLYELEPRGGALRPLEILGRIDESRTISRAREYRLVKEIAKGAMLIRLR